MLLRKQTPECDTMRAELPTPVHSKYKFYNKHNSKFPSVIQVQQTVKCEAEQINF